MERREETCIIATFSKNEKQKLNRNKERAESSSKSKYCTIPKGSSPILEILTNFDSKKKVIIIKRNFLTKRFFVAMTCY